MRLTPLLDRWPEDPAFRDLLAGLEDATGADVVVPDVARAFLLAGLARHTGRLLVAVTATTADAEALADDVGAALGAGTSAVFPAWETLPHERLPPRSETVSRRLELIHRLATGPAGLGLLATPARALMQPMAPGLDRLRPVTVTKGEERSLDDLLEALVAAGYQRTDMVERRGEVAVRGGIVDFFPPGAEHPARVEFWGDVVDDVRSFAVSSQRSLTPLPGVVAYPCRELVLGPAERHRARELAREVPGAADLLGPVAEGVDPDGVEALLPLLYDELAGLTDYLPGDALFALVDPKRTLDRAEEVRAQAEEALAASWAAAAEGGRAPAPGAAYRALEPVLAASGRPVLRVGAAAAPEVETIRIAAQGIEPYRANATRIATDARDLAAAGCTVLLCTEGHGPAERLAAVLADEGLAVPLVAELPDPLGPGVLVGTCPLLNGFRSDPLRLAVVGEGDLYGTRRQTRNQARLPSTRRRGRYAEGPEVSVAELQPGDVVVHQVHGIGRYVGMERRTVAGAERDYLLLAYDGDDRLYLPSDQVEAISRYVGGESPRLSKLGSREWDRQKDRVRRRVREMAAELLRLYAARMAAPGHGFGPDTPWQRELEDAFPYAETPDQLRAIEEVKADMEAPVPMDRLLCGDVGYGKTEVAVRAAFKAVMDGKQVGVLVPTTLLAQQHFATFSERFAPFPVRVAVLSRFQSPAEQQRVVTEMATGTLDLVIGTHRLLSADAKWSDLGLVVVDEEHRFGVAHKEHLKRLRTEVDVLTMTATPIPRTLELSVSGIRDLSVMETAPEERHPVLTFVGPYDESQVATAIRREMLREGQVFFVHNRVETISRVASALRRAVPEARIGVAHGQLDEEVLERTMIEFWDRAYDVLLCTTIIESGLDIPNANTLVVDRADALGLAQLYQLRGRVGRARERAYAYLLYPGERVLSESAHQRLATIASNAELGAGMAIAMKDLEIRGAGNLLGADQSGHVALVGYDLYMQMLAEAVGEMRGRPVEQPKELKLEAPVDANLPAGYVPRERLRLEVYRRLGGARSVEEVESLAAELADRYGPPPPAVRSLLGLAAVRAQATAVGLREVVCFGGRARFGPVPELPDSKQVRLSRLYRGAVWKPAEQVLLVPLPGPEAPLPAWLSGVLSDILDAPGGLGPDLLEQPRDRAAS